MARHKTLFTTTLAVVGLVCPCVAQQATANPGRLLVNVVDLHGNPVRQLAINDFRVRINGNPAKIVAANYSVAPRRVVVLLDMSGSMGGDRYSQKWTVARGALTDLLAQMPADTPIAMVTFSDKVGQVFNFSKPRSDVARWLAEGPSGRDSTKGHTSLFDAMIAGLKLLEPSQPGDSLIAITDGVENHSQSSKKSTETALLKSGVRLFAFFFHRQLPSEAEERQESFLNMVTESGGVAYVMVGHPTPGAPYWAVQYDDDKPSQERLKLLTQALDNQVRAVWMLDVELRREAKKNKVELEVVDQAGRRRKEVAYSYPHSLPSPE